MTVLVHVQELLMGELPGCRNVKVSLIECPNCWPKLLYQFRLPPAVNRFCGFVSFATLGIISIDFYQSNGYAMVSCCLGLNSYLHYVYLNGKSVEVWIRISLLCMASSGTSVLDFA